MYSSLFLSQGGNALAASSSSSSAAAPAAARGPPPPPGGPGGPPPPPSADFLKASIDKKPAAGGGGMAGVLAALSKGEGVTSGVYFVPFSFGSEGRVSCFSFCLKVLCPACVVVQDQPRTCPVAMSVVLRFFAKKYPARAYFRCMIFSLRFHIEYRIESGIRYSTNFIL